MPSNLEELERKIEEARAGGRLSEADLKRIKRQHDNKASMQAGYEFVGSVLLSAVLGYYIDKWLDTGPFFLISLFLLGTCAGFMSLYRLNKNLGMSVGFSELHSREKDAKKSPTAGLNEPNNKQKEE